MKTELLNKLSRTVHKVGFKLKKHSPEILVAVGVVGAVTSTVMACKATLKVNDILEESKNTVDKIHESVEQEKYTSDGKLYTQEVANKDLAQVYVQTGWKLAKLYGPAVVLGVSSLGCILASNNILRKRNVALAAAFAEVTTSFKEYRTRLIERFGDNGKTLDRELRYNIKAKQIEERVMDENGNETTVTKTVDVGDPNGTHDVYSVVFCEGNLGWTKSADLNKYFLIQVQNQANDKLKADGILTLNQVYDMLGVPRTQIGQFAGWVYTEDSSVGDNYVDFGIFDMYNEKACDFVNGYERSFIIDFNCMGDIIPYM